MSIDSFYNAIKRHLTKSLGEITLRLSMYRHRKNYQSPLALVLNPLTRDVPIHVRAKTRGLFRFRPPTMSGSQRQVVGEIRTVGKL